MKGKRSIGFKPRKGKKENSQKRSIEIKSRKEIKKVQETVDKLILKAKQLKKYISIAKKDAYKPIRISGAFSDNFVEYKSDSKKDELIARYLSNIREHLRKLINDKKKNGDWKIQLIMKINFISSKNFNETRDMHSRSDTFEIMIGVDTIEIVRNRFNYILRRYKKGLAISMRGSEFLFDHVESINYIFHKVDLKRSGSYIEDFSSLEKEKKLTINCHNKKDNKCFQYAITTALNYDEIKENHHRVSKVKPFIDKYDWTDVNFPSHVNDWKRF